jgi:uncharacterized protein YndB with AHSA1/START domain
MNLASTLERTRSSPTLRAASVRVTRELGAAPERIFDAWVNAKELRVFLFAGRLGDAVSADIEPRVGGEFSIVRQSGGKHIEYSGEYLEIDRPQRLVFSLYIEKYAQCDDRVIVELAPVAGQSLLVLSHELSLADPAQRSRIQRGWARVLDRLAALLVSTRH